MKKVCAEFVFQSKATKGKSLSVLLTVFYGTSTYSIVPSEKVNAFCFIGSNISDDTTSTYINLLFEANEFAKKELSNNA